MKPFREFYKADLFRYGGKVDSFTRKFLKAFRKAQNTKNKIIRSFWRLRFYLLKNKRNIGISSNTKIGKGLYLGHLHGISINGLAVIGDNCNIHKGVTIGQENRGKRKGTPIIGNSVWIGVNATIVGNVSVGDDVLIAPNSFVNCDIPSHSVVFGNPCQIHHKDNATEDYIINKV